MIRNHLLVDPESSPTKPLAGSAKAYDNSFNSSDDPWFNGSEQGSPSSSHSNTQHNQPVYNFNQTSSSVGGYGYNNQFGGNSNNSFASAPFDDNFEDEPPLLEELGIRFDHILSKTQAVMYPRKVIIINHHFIAYHFNKK